MLRVRSAGERILLISPFMPRVCVLAGVFAACLVGLSCKASPTERVKRADRFVAEKKFSEAIVEYRAALQQDAKNGEARLKLADLHAQQGEVQNAYREYVRAADTLPDNAEAQLKAGAMLLMAGRFADAKVRAENVLRTAAEKRRGLDASRQRARRPGGFQQRVSAARRGD